MMWMVKFFSDKNGKSQGHLERKCKKIVYCAYLRENGSIYNTEIIFGRFYTYCKRHFPTQNTNFWYVCL